MSDTTQPTFRPRSEFVRTEVNPQSYALVALNSTDTLRCHCLSSAALSALCEVFGDEMRQYGENAENQVAEFVFRNSPWGNKTIRSETLLTNLFAVLLVHQYTFLTTIDYGRQYLDKLSLTFTRPASISNPAPATESVFALSFTAPSVLRIVAAPLHATPAILQSVRGAWPRGVKSERKLGNGSWEFRLRGFGYFSAEKSDEAVLPHVFTLLRALDGHAFKLLAAVPIGGRSRAKDLWLFTAPGSSRPGRNSPGGSASVQGTASNGPTSPYPATIESSEPYSPGPFVGSPGGHAKYATDEPERAVPLASGHAKSPSEPSLGSPGYRKPAPVPSPNGSPAANTPTAPGLMTMPVPVIPPAPTQSSPNSSPAPVPVPIPVKRNSSLLRKFRAGGGSANGRTPSAGFKHPPPPPGFKPDGGSVSGKSDGGSVKSKRGSVNGSLRKRGHGRQRSLASGEIIYETPTPQPSISPSPNPSPNPPMPASPSVAAPASPAASSSPVSPTSPVFVPPPPPPPLLQSPIMAIPQSPVVVTPEHQAMPMPIPAIMTTSPTTTTPSLASRPDMLSAANHTTEELLPRTAFRDSAFSTNTDLSHNVEVAWTGGAAGDLDGVKEEVDEVEARSPDVTRSAAFDEKRPKSEKAELAIVEPGPPPPLPTSSSTIKEEAGTSLEGERNKDVKAENGDNRKHTKQPSKSGSTPNEWVFVSVDKGKGTSESPGSQLEEMPSESPPPLQSTRRGSIRKWWFGAGAGEAKPKSKRRRGGMVQALRSSKRLSIE